MTTRKTAFISIIATAIALVLIGTGCSSGNDATDSSGGFGRRKCIEPENPYSSGSGHYAGYEWGVSGNGCDGNSQSFIEGCEEYERRAATYDSCH